MLYVVLSSIKSESLSSDGSYLGLEEGLCGGDYGLKIKALRFEGSQGKGLGAFEVCQSSTSNLMAETLTLNRPVADTSHLGIRLIWTGFCWTSLWRKPLQIFASL